MNSVATHAVPKKTLRLPTLLVATVAALGCQDGRGWFGRADFSPPDSLPVLLNDSLPFDYPLGLYLQLIDDSVTLRLHVDEFGRPVPESTAIAVKATYAQFDTAALDGSRELLFSPAYRKGKAIAHTILFPINFRIPTVKKTSPDSAPPATDSASR